jgi:hypothetical protein
MRKTWNFLNIKIYGVCKTRDNFQQKTIKILINLFESSRPNLIIRGTPSHQRILFLSHCISFMFHEKILWHTISMNVINYEGRKRIWDDSKIVHSWKYILCHYKDNKEQRNSRYYIKSFFNLVVNFKCDWTDFGAGRMNYSIWFEMSL